MVSRPKLIIADSAKSTGGHQTRRPSLSFRHTANPVSNNPAATSATHAISSPRSLPRVWVLATVRLVVPRGRGGPVYWWCSRGGDQLHRISPRQRPRLHTRRPG